MPYRSETVSAIDWTIAAGRLIAEHNWPEIFNNDTTLTSALLDRLLHHADTCVVEGKSYRAKDHNPEA
jgi:DNA replication protein DnaC